MNILCRALFLASFGIPVMATPAIAAPTQKHAAHKTDKLQAKLIARIDAVDVKLAAARKAGRVTTTQAVQVKKKLAAVRTDSARYAKQQGFLSAGESASY